nr:hypothetical protein [uncultured Deefgea sp.]
MMNELRLSQVARILGATICAMLGIYFAIASINTPMSLLRMLIAITLLLIAIGLWRKLNWARIPAELALAFMCFLLSSYFFPSPDAKNSSSLQYLLADLSPLMTTLVHFIGWLPLLAMAYVISNSGPHYKKQWW